MKMIAILSGLSRRAAVTLLFAATMATAQEQILKPPANTDQTSPAGDDVPVIDVAPAPTALSNPALIERKIREALEGGKTSAASDPVLDEVLQIIQRNGGSVLRGSQLDQHSNTVPGMDVVSSQGDADFEAEARARAAEMLLRTARFLMQIGPIDEMRLETVNRMRREAIRLLLE